MLSKKAINRRSFLVQTGAAALTFSIIKPHLIKTYAANEKISLGLIGCGGRGNWIMYRFREHGGYGITACADYFPDRVNRVGANFNIPEEKRFTTLSGYKRLLEESLDAVAIIAAPYFHPEIAAAAVEAGKHVYLAKPVAVDVPGCRTVEKSGQVATEKKRCFLVDFQTRTDQYYQESIRRVHAGAIGDFAFGESIYHADTPWKRMEEALAEDPSNSENRLKAWALDKYLSGDIITEQNIHTLDVMSWIMNSEPVSAAGTGGRKVRTDAGNCFDHFVITYEYPNDIGIAFSSRQFHAFGLPQVIQNRMFGSKGVLLAEWAGRSFIRGDKENVYAGGASPNIYTDGAKANIGDFYNNIVTKNFKNPTVPPSVRSNLVTILGRKAAYEDRKVTWAELMRDDTMIDPGFEAGSLKS